MRILHVVPTYAPGFRYGGPVASVRGLAEAQARRGHRVTVATTDRDEGVRLAVPLKVETRLCGVSVRYFHAVGPGRLRFAPGLGRWLARAAGDFDLVHAHGLFAATTTMALAAARRAGAPTVLAPRGMLMAGALGARGHVRKRLWLAGPEAKNLAALGAWHLTAGIEAQELPAELAPKAVRFLAPNGVDPPLFDGTLDGLPEPVAQLLGRTRPFALFLGRVNWKKGLDRLLAALALADGELDLVVAGPEDGWGTELERRRAALGLADRVFCLGPVQGRAKEALLAAASVFCLPSRSENFGNGVLEALSVGLPAVVTPEVGAAEAVRATGGGKVVAGEPELLARALEQLAFADGARGPDVPFASLARALYGWDAIAGRVEAGYAATLRARAA